MAKRGKNLRPSWGVIARVIAVGLVLYAGVSLVSFIFRGYPGRVGYLLASALIHLFGGMSVWVVTIAVVAVALWVFEIKRWRQFLGFCVLVLAVFFGASLLSVYAGLKTPCDNFCGWTGAFLGKSLTDLFGIGTLALMTLGFYWGFNLWFRKPQRKDIRWSFLILFYGLILELFFAYFHAPLSLAGIFGKKTVSWLLALFGSVGTFLILISVLIILLSVSEISTHWRELSKRLFVNMGRWLRVHFRRRCKVGVKVSPPEKAKITMVEQKPQPTIFHTAEKDGMIAEPPSFHNKPVKLDMRDFQKEFLERLDQPTSQDKVFKDPVEAEAEGEVLMGKLREFGIDGKLTAILSGPMITRFELEPAPGVRCSGIESLADDIALALSAERVRILAPIPGKSAVGVEIPNKTRRMVYLKEVLTSPAYQELDSPLGFALGTTITGEPYCADLRSMPHVLIAGTTGSGKSVCINSIIMSIIYRSTPQEVRFLTIDPKQLELPVYNPVPHLLSMTTTDPERVVGELTRIVEIMEARYSEFAELGVRDILSFNARCEEMGKRKKPYIVVVIDELADLMQRAPAEIEARIIRLAQMSRAVGIHLILATQRPSVDVITGLIKANFPCRIAFQVATKVDSRTILDANGAESLLGRGDMLFLPPGKGEPVRLHGSYVSERAAKRVVDLWAIRYLSELLSGLVDDEVGNARQVVDQDLVDVLYDPRRAAKGKKRERLEEILTAAVVDKLLAKGYYEPLDEEIEIVRGERQGVASENGEFDEFFAEAARLVVTHREASVSMLQRRLDVGWARAGRIIDQLERAGIVGPHAGSKPRKVLIEDEGELERKLQEIFKKE
ncbi:MAG: DNA translocase FtsK 4TM domain-containing protein [candidate division WOR-3 bacterium]